MWGLCILNLNRSVEWWYFVLGDLQHLDDWSNFWTCAAAAAILQPTRYPIEDSHVKLSSEDPQFHPLTFSCPWHVLVTCWWFGIFVVYLARHSFSLPLHWRSWKSHLTIMKAKHLCCLKSILHCSASLWQTQSSEMNFSIEESAVARWGLRCIFVLFFPSSDSRNFQCGQVSVWWSQTEAQWIIYCGWNGAADLNGKLGRWLVWLLRVTKPTQIHRSCTCPNNPAGLVQAAGCLCKVEDSDGVSRLLCQL